DATDDLTSLREAINYANSHAGADAITFSGLFDSPQTITLSSGPLTLTDAATTTIAGPGAKLLSVSGNDVSGVFAVNAGASAALSGLTITGGRAAFGAGANNFGTLTLSDCAVEDNTGTTGGGGVCNENGATLTATGSTFSGNYGANYGGGGILNG